MAQTFTVEQVATAVQTTVGDDALEVLVDRTCSGLLMGVGFRMPHGLAGSHVGMNDLVFHRQECWQLVTWQSEKDEEDFARERN